MRITLGLLCLIYSCRLFAFSIENLRTDYAVKPIGIDNPNPVFSWIMESDKIGEQQKDFRLIVSDEDGNMCWDSGKVSTSVSHGIKYDGKELSPRTVYNLQLSVTNMRNETAAAESSFTTGLMTESDLSDAWKGAKWIGGDQMAKPFDAFYLPVFRICYSLHLEETDNTQKASFVYGANDKRLEEGAMIEVELDNTGLKEGSPAILNIYRKGYSKEDKPNIPLFSLEIEESVINGSNQYGRHEYEIVSSCGSTSFLIDGNAIGKVNLNHVGEGGDYNAYPIVGDIGFKMRDKGVAYFRDVTVRNFRHPYGLLASLPDHQVNDGVQLYELPSTGLTMVRTDFNTPKPIKRAMLYATARGVYDFLINGKRVTESYLNPGCTQYNKTHYYQTFDVTDFLKSGENAMGAVLGEGWWSGAISFTPENWNYWADSQSLLANLTVTYADGTEETFVTNPYTWTWNNCGPYRYGSIFQGEIYDANKADIYCDWTSAGYIAQDWKPAQEIDLEETISKEPVVRGFITWPTVEGYEELKLKSQIGMPVDPNRIIDSKSLSERDGCYIYDMGQNMAGVPRVTFRNLQPGTVIKLRYAEVLYPDLEEYEGLQGSMMVENLRAAMAQDIYIAKGGTETYQPRFTYHGYRYLEIEGLDSPLAVEEVQGVVLSTIDRFVGNFTTDNADLNRFVENVKWSSLANIFSIPTDCPQRNERMGWSGDLSVFCPSLSYLYDAANFYRRHMDALEDCLTPEGSFPAIAPIGGGFGGPIWESIGIVLPWQSYLHYGDVEALKNHYPVMKCYVQHVLEDYIDSKDGHYKAHDTWSDLGDWLGFEVNRNDNTLIFDCYLVYELDLMSRMAAVLGYDEDAARWKSYSNVRRHYIVDNYFNEEGKTVGCGYGLNKMSPTGLIGSKPKGELIDTQTSYALPVVFGIVEDSIRSSVMDNLHGSVSRPGIADDGTIHPPYSLMTGFIGTAWIMHALTEANKLNTAYELLLNTSFPSWLYPVTQGATSIWERLNSMTLTDGFGGNNSMNSFNHYAFGSVTDWLFKSCAGICPDEESVGFKHFILNPHPDFSGRMNRVESNYESLYGNIESSWRVEGDNIIYEFTVPANTTATMILPDEAGQELVSGTHRFVRPI